MMPALQTAANIDRGLLVEHSLIPGEPVGADLSCTSPIYRP